MEKELIDTKELEEMPVEERLKKLDELKKTLKEEENKVERMIDDAQEEVERKRNHMLFRESGGSVEDLMFETPQNQNPETLEQSLPSQTTERQPGAQGLGYSLSLGLQPTQYLYQRAYELAQNIYEGEASEEDVREISQLQSAVEQRTNDIEQGNYTSTEQIVNQLSTSRRIIHSLMEKYKT